jgi:alpha-ribazole phosphatase
MKIIAVRHTSVDMPSGICYGQTDVETSSTFDIEKEKIAQMLLPEEIHAVYSSPLTRCRLLAEYITKDIPAIYDSRLMELNFGRWEGRYWKEIAKTDDGKLWFNDWINTSCPEGESYRQLITRVDDFLQHIILVHNNNRVLIVTHGGVIRALISQLCNIEPQKAFDMKIDYGGIVKLSAQ